MSDEKAIIPESEQDFKSAVVGLNANKFTLFYSWQSDYSKTRYFIRDCIDEAIDLAQEAMAIEAERDEATKNTTGSPNIVTTLFSKIDTCDLFIADITLCFKGDEKSDRRAPNPNVLLELGYAVKTLGWERVICLCNGDNGKEYPFDVSHNRITDFSLTGKSRAEEKYRIAKIIFRNIRDLQNGQPRTKLNMAAHNVGGYDPRNQKVIKEISPIIIGQQESYTLHNDELLHNARILVAEIEELNRKKSIEKQMNERVKKELEEYDVAEIPWAETTSSWEKTLQETQSVLSDPFKAWKSPVVWKTGSDDADKIKQWLGVDVSEDFFDLDGLEKMKGLSLVGNDKLEGEENEKEKYYKLCQLSYTLHKLDLRTRYINTFIGMCFIPIAIQNITTIQDTDIRLVVTVDVGEIVDPDESLIVDDLEGLQGLLCRNDDEKNDIGVIAELFILPEDGIIHAELSDDDLFSYTPEVPVLDGFGYSRPKKTEKDYKEELEQFIASSDGHGHYEFDVRQLRPNECRWLSKGILVKPIEKRISIHYQIYSSHSDGTQNGTLEYIAM